MSGLLATYLARPADQAELLGHRSIETTMIYAHMIQRRAYSLAVVALGDPRSRWQRMANSP